MVLIAQLGLFYGILVLLLIMVFSFRRNKNKIFLGFSLFCVWYSLLIIYLNYTGQILQYPALLRTGVIASYLEFPLLYIYSRNTFYPGRLLHRFDWLLLLPAVLYVIDFMPFFLLPGEQKISLWLENLASKERMFLADEGWFGLSGFHYPFIYIWIAIIMYFQIRLIARNWNLDYGFKSAHNRRLLYFIVTITLLYLPLEIPGVFGILLKLPWFNFKFIGITYGISLSAISIYLFISPKILYGFIPEIKFARTDIENTTEPRLLENEVVTESREENGSKQRAIENNKLPASSNKYIDDQELSAELAILLAHMTQNKPYKKQGFTIQELSNQTGIPVYQLSPLINGYIKMNFANWINRYRIEYFVELARENQQITLEALSHLAGFTSRSNFITAFKKKKGVTPKQYLKELTFSE